ncbi:MAG: ABC transporter ATP-binding protein, partial [Spirochaetales bacterium]|nr:ABC transporter ATP-binding protein [Spirochaetales bacterium]
MQNNCAIELKNIRKTFGSVVANDDINLEINKGEILCLLGENGSGKTTLMNMLSGIYQPDSGEIFKEGKQVSIRSPKDAYALGIGMIHQHYHLVDVFTAAQNIILGLDNEKMDLGAVNDKVKGICDKYGFNIDPKKKIYDMSVSQKQTIEIVKVLYRGADILILDEPTAVLTPQETEKLFTVLRNMKKDNKAIILITHKLAEVLAVSDKVAILRKGRYIGTIRTSEATAQSLTDMMVGHAVTLNIDRPIYEHCKDKLEVSGLTVMDNEGIRKLDDVTFTARTGEILGVAGIAGSGQRELLEAITGLYPISSGSIKFIEEDGSKTELVGKTPMQIRQAGVGMGFVPEDRLGMGLVGSMGMTNNMMLRSWRSGNSIFFNRKNPENLANKVWKDLEVVTPSTEFPVRRMSGGNIQKVLVGREIASHPPVLLTAYAVRGLDINT